MLGLRWDTSGDFYYFDPSSLIRQVETCDVLTKRKLLQVASKLFDLVGFILPIVINVKVIFQDPWKVGGLGWDSVVADNVKTKWEGFIEDLASSSLFSRFVQSCR